jgi:hypothetical protein
MTKSGEIPKITVTFQYVTIQQTFTQQFGLNAALWFTYSKALKDSAVAVLNDLARELEIAPQDLYKDGLFRHEPANERFRVFLLLLGYAFETLFKAIIIKNLPAGKEFKDFSHDIDKLCTKAGVKREQGDWLLFNMLTTITTFTGKYPLAKKEDDYKKIHALETLITKRSQMPPGIVSNALSHWERIYQEYKV